MKLAKDNLGVMLPELNTIQIKDLLDWRDNEVLAEFEKIPEFEVDDMPGNPVSYLLNRAAEIKAGLEARS